MLSITANAPSVVLRSSPLDVVIFVLLAGRCIAIHSMQQNSTDCHCHQGSLACAPLRNLAMN